MSWEWFKDKALGPIVAALFLAALVWLGTYLYGLLTLPNRVSEVKEIVDIVKTDVEATKSSVQKLQTSQALLDKSTKGATKEVENLRAESGQFIQLLRDETTTLRSQLTELTTQNAELKGSVDVLKGLADDVKKLGETTANLDKNVALIAENLKQHADQLESLAATTGRLERVVERAERVEFGKPQGREVSQVLLLTNDHVVERGGTVWEIHIPISTDFGEPVALLRFEFADLPAEWDDLVMEAQLADGIVRLLMGGNLGAIESVLKNRSPVRVRLVLLVA